MKKKLSFGTCHFNIIYRNTMQMYALFRLGIYKWPVSPPSREITFGSITIKSISHFIPCESLKGSRPKNTYMLSGHVSGLSRFKNIYIYT